MKNTIAADMIKSLAVLTVALIGVVRLMFARTMKQRMSAACSTDRLIERVKSM